MKDYYVVLNKNSGARIERNLKKAEELSKEFIVMKNPDLSRVKKISPSFWKLIGEEIHPMTEEEQVVINNENKVINSSLKIIKANETDLFIKKEHLDNISSNFTETVNDIKSDFYGKFIGLTNKFEINSKFNEQQIQVLAEKLKRSEASLIKKLRILAAIIFAASTAVAYILIKVGI